MSDQLGGEQLEGGAISRGIVRAGDVVRRPAGPWTETVHGYLEDLADSGLLVPRPLGREGDVEVLTYIQGAPLWAPGNKAYLSGRDIAEFGALLRRYHDVAATVSVRETAAWNRLPIEPAEAPDIVCHNDFAPWNILRTPEGLAIIDWDLAAPGTPLWDLAYAAWTTVPMWNDDDIEARGIGPIANRTERLCILLDAYQATPTERARVLDVVPDRLAAAIEQARVWAGEGRPGWQQQWLLPDPFRHGGGYRRDIAFIAAHKAEWMDAVTT